MGGRKPPTASKSLQELKGLSLKFMANALAPSTRRTYHSAGSQYKKFCDDHGVLPFPISEDVLTLYVTRLATFSSHSNIKVHLAAIRYYSIYYTGDSPIRNFQRLYYLIKGIKRMQGRSRKKPLRAPVTPAVLRQIQISLFSSTRTLSEKWMLWTALLTAFFGFLRVSEYTASHKNKYDPLSTLCVSDVKVTTDSLHVHIKVSKTDPFRDGVTLNVARNGSNLCPHQAMTEYLKVRQWGPGPLFTFPDGKYLTRHDVNKVLTESTRGQISVSSHSLRIGAASTAATMGCPKWLIQCMGRWNSDCFRNYIRVSPAMIQKTSRALARCRFHQVPVFRPA